MPTGMPSSSACRAVKKRPLAIAGKAVQRIALARAFLKDAPSLWLDESTEGLDAWAEQAVLQSLDGLLMTGETVLVIAHWPQVLA